MSAHDRPEHRGGDLSREARRRLHAELEDLRARREELTASLGGDAPSGDRADQAEALERAMELERVEERVAEVARLLEAGGATEGEKPKGDVVAVGTDVTVRLPDGTGRTFRVGDLAEEDDETTVATPDSPFGQALLGHRAGDEVTYQAPDGQARVAVVSVRAWRDPPARG